MSMMWNRHEQSTGRLPTGNNNWYSSSVDIDTTTILHTQIKRLEGEIYRLTNELNMLKKRENEKNDLLYDITLRVKNFNLL